MIIESIPEFLFIILSRPARARGLKLAVLTERHNRFQFVTGCALPAAEEIWKTSWLHFVTN